MYDAVNNLCTVLSATILAACVYLGMAAIGAADRFELIPTPRGTIVLDKAEGQAYQLPPLPMFAERK